MSGHEGVTTRLDEPEPGRVRVIMPDRAMWSRVLWYVAYVLIAGPRGLGFTIALALGLVLDLSVLTVRLLLASTFGLLYAAARAMLWLLRNGLRFLWVGAITLVVWVLQTSWWLIVGVGGAVGRGIAGVPRAIRHPRGAWRRASTDIRSERDRARVSRKARAARSWAITAPTRGRGERFFEVGAAGLKRLRRQVMPERWFFVPPIWWRLALWERRHTMRWLGIVLPSFEPPDTIPAARTALLSRLPVASLGFLLAKLPLGVLAVTIVALGVVGAGSIIDDRHLPTELVVFIPVVVVYALYGLARVSARYAHHAFSPSAAVRRLYEAEALAAQERAKAERAEQSRRDLIINVGHELRTPTASILGHVESVLLALDAPGGQLPPETLRSYLGIVQREAERLSSLVDDLLAVARAERDELHLALAPVDGAEVIAEVYEALAPLARRERQVMVVHEVQPDLPLVRADRQRLTQVLLNLVRNAIMYTPAGGIVSIELHRPDGDRLLFSVADTGSGIAAADLQRVFERFFRADASRARSSGGFGLGLAIARDLVEAMGGTITAESVVGEGSCFRVSLPIAADDA
jgi:two-component system, OmpR family, phosphate regulon sensor histidine kinase PhoR